jgi:hypothetical protein
MPWLTFRQYGDLETRPCFYDKATHAAGLLLVFANEIAKEQRRGLDNTKARDAVYADGRQ